VEVIAKISRQRAAVLYRNAANPIKRVADQRMPGRSKMNPNLMRPSGRNSHFQQRTPFPPLQHLDAAMSRFPIR
jgi:hypothetical protein